MCLELPRAHFRHFGCHLHIFHYLQLTSVPSFSLSQRFSHVSVFPLALWKGFGLQHLPDASSYALCSAVCFFFFFSFLFVLGWIVFPWKFMSPWNLRIWLGFFFFFWKIGSLQVWIIRMRSCWVNDFLGGSVVKNLLVIQEMWVQSLSQKDSLGKEMVTHSSILA